MDSRPEPFYGPRLPAALAYAADIHAHQARKGKNEPYISHILRVAGLVAHYGGDEDQIIAAALHDAAEDHGGEPRAREIGELFGRRVEQIVRECSDSLAESAADKSPWRQRKEAYLARISADDPHGAHLVEGCDKLANLQDIVEDIEAFGVMDSLSTFRGGVHGVVWYYQELHNRLMPYMPPALAEAYGVLLSRLEAAVSTPL